MVLPILKAGVNHNMLKSSTNSRQACGSSESDSVPPVAVVINPSISRDTKLKTPERKPELCEESRSGMVPANSVSAVVLGISKQT